MSGPARTHGDLIDAARALAPRLRATAASAEADRRPDDGVMAEVGALGIFGLMSPRCYGGSELDLDTFFEVGLALGQGDASQAWVITFCIEHVWMLCQFPQSFQEQLFADRSYVLAPAMLSPSGVATAVEGGHRLSGRWKWATGVAHADWVIAGAVLRDDGRAPRAVFFALPRDEVSVDDTWNFDGMCATASHDVVIDDRFVPADRAVEIGEMMNGTGPGSRLHRGPLYSTPMAPILSFAASLPILGQARFALDEYAHQLGRRAHGFGPSKQAERPGRQVALGEAGLEVDAAEALMRKVLAEVMAGRNRADVATRVRWTSSIGHAVAMCRRVVSSVCRTAGASSHFLDNPLQRVHRDVNAMASHLVFDTDDRYGALGRTLLGLDPANTWY